MEFQPARCPQFTKKRQKVLVGVLFVFVFSTFVIKPYVFAASGINGQINFQGKLVNSDGTNVTNGSNYELVFRLYDASTAGNVLWTETHTGVTVTDGVFRVALGSATSLSSVDFNSDSLYLSIQISKDAAGSATGESEMSPRIRFTAVPYAFNAQKVNGLTVTNNGNNTLNIGNGLTLAVSTASKTFTGAGTTITFAGNFTTAGANALTLTTTGTTDVTLPTTGTLATLTGTETLSGKTLTAPKFVDGGFIADAAGLEMLIFDSNTTAVNQLTINNAAAGNGLSIAATGDDTNVALSLVSKAAGALTIDSGTTGTVNLGTGNNAKTIAIGTGTAGNTINIATDNTTSDTITIGSLLDNIAITSDAWSITNAGALTVASCSGCGSGSSAWSGLSAPSANLSLAHDTYTTSFTFNGLTTGTAFALSSDAGITSGELLDLTSSAASGFTGSLLDINLSDATGASSNTGTLLTLTNAGTANANTSLYIKHYATGTNNLAFRIDDESSDSTPFVIDGSGNVGIGSTSPQGRFDATTDTSGQTLGYFRDNGRVADLRVNATATNIMQLKAGSGDSLQLAVNNTDNTGIRIDSGGNVGIGTTTPTSALLEVGSSSGFKVNSSGAITALTGLVFTSGNFDMSASSGTFSTGTGAVSLNGVTTLAASKALIIAGGSGDPTATNGTVWYDTTAHKFKIVENGAVKIICNTTDAGCGSGGSTTWDTIGDPSGNGAINMAQTAQTLDWTMTTDAALDGLSITVTNGLGTDTTTQRGLVITNKDDATTTGATDALLVLNNADTNEAVTAAISITNTGGGGYTNILSTPSITISGTGAITGAAGLSTTTVTASSVIAANGGITFDNATDTLGAHTAAGTYDMNTNLITNIGATGTDFTATGGLNLADALAIASGGLTITAGGATVTDGALAVNSGSITSTATNLTIGATTAVILGDGGNTFTFSETAGPSYAGTARPTKTITLSPEYPGAVLTTFYGAGTDSNVTGSLTSDAETSSTHSLRTYYQWERTTDATLHYYTVAVRVKLPKDFSAWATSNALQVDFVTDTTGTTANVLDVYIYLESNSTTSVASSTGNASSVADTWATITIDDSVLDDASAPEWDAADETAVIYLRMGSASSEHVRVGDIRLNYLAAF